jgi:hypothetical protein
MSLVFCLLLGVLIKPVGQPVGSYGQALTATSRRVQILPMTVTEKLYTLRNREAILL